MREMVQVSLLLTALCLSLNAQPVETKLLASDGRPEDEFGYSVAVTENFLLVGAPFDSNQGGAPGSVYVFQLNVNGMFAGATYIFSDFDTVGPYIAHSIPGQFKEINFSTYIVAELDTVFSDNDTPDLTYSVATDGNTTAIVDNNLLILDSVDGFVGMSTVTVEATNSVPYTVSDNFIVYIQPPVSTEENSGSHPEAFLLRQNYPNPFNPSTEIGFHLPVYERVTLTIFDMQGRIVKRILDNHALAAGNYQFIWDGLNEAGIRAASGVYFYTLQANNGDSNESSFSQVRKMLSAR